MKNGKDNAPPEKDNAPPVSTSRFKPRIPVRKYKAAAVVTVEKSEKKGEIIDKELLAKLNNAKVENDGSTMKPKIGRKSASVKVAFGHGRTSTIRKFGHPKNAVTESNHEDDGSIIAYARSPQKEYVEPWDYENSVYPVTLPLRQPNSGDPEILDRKEFGDDLTEETRKIVTPAEELDFMDANNEPELLFFQLPEVLPFIGRAYDQNSIKMENAKASNEGKDILPEDTKRNEEKFNNARCLNHLPAGRLGKMIVYKSGKIKMKIGDTLFDVSPGQNCIFAQEVAAISVKEKKCSIIKSITKRAIVTPDVDFLLESTNKM